MDLFKIIFYVGFYKIKCLYDDTLFSGKLYTSHSDAYDAIVMYVRGHSRIIEKKRKELAL